MPSDVNSGLEGVVAAETTISLIDGQAGRLLYRGYEIGDLAAHGSYDRVVGLLLDGEWPLRDEVLPAAELSPTVLAALRGLPTSCAPLDDLRTAVSAFGAERRMDWPPTAEQARELIALVRDVPCKFNLIPFNPFPNTEFKTSSRTRILAFQRVLRDAGLVATIRKTRGEDIDAACGQLAGQVQDRTRRALRRIQPVAAH